MNGVRASNAPPDAPPTVGARSVERRLEHYVDPIRSVLEGTDPSGLGETVVLVPDARYPFHPSTGLVTDPAIVGATARVLATEYDAEVRVAPSRGEFLEPDRAYELLGYAGLLETVDAEIVELDDSSRQICHWSGNGDGPTWFSLPTAMVDHSVVVLPTLRPTRGGTAAGAVRTLASSIDPSLPAVAAVAAADVVEPDCALLDATAAYVDGPCLPGVVVGGPVLSVDAVATRLLDGAVGDDPVLREAIDSDEVTVECDGYDLEQLRRALPGGQYPAADEPSALVAGLYDLYATVSGDVVPPQLSR